MRALLGCGVYLPRLRLARSAVAAAHAWFNPKLPAKGERSYASWDEDALTMGVEAARASSQGDATHAAFGAIALASTTLPFADRSNAGLLAAALGREGELAARDHAGSLRAGTSALYAALQGAADAEAPATLVVASDARDAKPASPQEGTYGHGAVAFLVGESTRHPGHAVLAEYLGGTSLTADFVDHHRAADADFDYVLEERWVRDEAWGKLLPQAVTKLFAQAKVTGQDITHCVLPAGAPVQKLAAKQLGLAEGCFADTLAARVGDTGTAHALLMLAATLERAQPGALVLVIGFGQGIDALLFRAGPAAGQARAGGFAAALASGRTDTTYTRYLAHRGLLQMELGMRGERDNRTAQSVAWRKRRTVTAFIGGRCRACGTVQYPLSRCCVAPDCRQFDTQDEARLADTVGTLKTFTEDWLAYTPAPPLVYGNVGFADGGNAFIEYTDFAPGEAQVGQPVRFAFRIKDRDALRDFQRYFWKAVPMAAAGT